MGISRSATIVIALMMKRYKIDLKTAFKKVVD
jgi:protein-tyrosine phosphatase